MSWTQIRWITGCLLLVVSLAVLAWSAWPEKVILRELPLTLADSVSADPSSVQIAALPAQVQVLIQEPRRLSVEWPASIRVGSTGVLRMQLEPQAQTAGTAGAPGTGTVILDAHLEAPGLEYRPAGEVSQAIVAGQPLAFVWNIRSAQPGVLPGRLWLHLRFTAQDGSSAQRWLVTAQPFEIRFKTLAGMDSSTALLWGGVGLILGLALVFDGLLKLIVSIFEKWKRTHGESAPAG
jgi:hypothetical protein